MVGKLSISAAVLISSCFFFIQTTQFKKLKAVEQIGPEIWPQIILTFLIILSVMAFVSDFLKRRKEATRGQQNQTNNNSMLFKGGFWCLLYVALLDIVGFAIITPIFVVGFSILLGVKKKWVLFLTSILLTAGIVALFSGVFYVVLPRGVGFFREINHFFY